MASSADHAVRRGTLALLLALVATLGASGVARAAAVGLGGAERFSVLGATTVTNTGPSVLDRDLGVSPGTAIVGFPPGTAGGTTHVNDGVAQQAQSDLTVAYDDAAGRSSTASVAADLAGRTLVPGVYTSATGLGLSGDLTLDAGGDPAAVFVFQAGSTLTTGAGSRVLLTGGAQACNVFWQVGSSATLGSASAFSGTILALTSITLTTGATVDGRALARNGAVTLDANTFTRSSCTTPVAPAPTATPSATPSATPIAVPTATPDPVPTAPAGGPTPGPSGPTTTAVTGAATQIGQHGAVVVGLAQGGTAFFQFGRTRGYGERTKAKRVRGRERLRARLRHLRPSTRYHYRLVVVGPGGRRTRGRDRTFRTPRRPARAPVRPGGFTG